MGSLVAHICHINVEIIGELVFDGQVPLLRVGQMTLVELAIDAGIFTVIERQVKERRRLVLSASEALAEQRSRCDTAIARAENDVGVETVASTADARVPAGVAQRLKEHTVTTADYSLRVHRIRNSKAWREV